MLGQNIQQFDEALGVPVNKVDGMRTYNWGSYTGTRRWLAACFDSNGTVQAVYFYKEGVDFTPDEYADMDQVLPEASYTWEAHDASKGFVSSKSFARLSLRGSSDKEVYLCSEFYLIRLNAARRSKPIWDRSRSDF